MDEGFLFDGESTRRIGRVVRAVENAPVNERPRVLGAGARNGAVSPEVVRVPQNTVATAEGLYAGFLQGFDPTSGNVTWNDFAPCWVQPVPSAPMATGNSDLYFLAKRIGPNPNDVAEGLIYVITGPPLSMDCTPIVTDVQCINGMLYITYKYLYIPSNLGIVISDSPCGGSASGSI